MSWLLAPLALVCLIALIWVAFGFALSAIDRGVPENPSLAGISTFAREWAAHVVDTLLHPLGWVQLGPRPFGPALDPEHGGHVPVLMIPGYGSNRSCFLFLAAYLRRRGWRWVWGVNNRPHSGGIERFAEALAARVDELRAVSGAERVDLVAHSMGGVVAATYLRTYGGAKVRRLITLGSPLQGTRVSVFGRRAEARDLLPNSKVIAGLGELSVPAFALISDRDHMTIPSTSMRPPWVQLVELEQVGHVEMLSNAKVFRTVQELLAREESAP